MLIEEVLAERLPRRGRKINPTAGGNCWGLIILALPPDSNYVGAASLNLALYNLFTLVRMACRAWARG